MRFVARTLEPVRCDAGLTRTTPQPPVDTGAPDEADASTLRLDLRMLLGDRPFQMINRIDGRAATARFRRTRRALARH